MLDENQLHEDCIDPVYCHKGRYIHPLDEGKPHVDDKVLKTIFQPTKRSKYNQPLYDPVMRYHAARDTPLLGIPINPASLCGYDLPFIFGEIS